MRQADTTIALPERCILGAWIDGQTEVKQREDTGRRCARRAAGAADQVSSVEEAAA
jgi:hypothetical protein